jgi:hypothetical protein
LIARPALEADDDSTEDARIEGAEESAFPPPYLRVVPDAPASDVPPDAPTADAGDNEASFPPDAGEAFSGTEDDDSPAGEPHSTDNGSTGPAALPGYDRMTLAQVRGRLRGLSPDDVAGLLAYEQGGAQRAPYLTLLTNRMATLEHEPQ